jgi:hypothetical protein
MSAEIERANKAKSVLDSPAFQEAFVDVRLGIIAALEKCPMADNDAANDLRRCLKLLTLLKANLQGRIQTGKIVEFRLAEEAKRSKNPLRGIFR